MNVSAEDTNRFEFKFKFPARITTVRPPRSQTLKKKAETSSETPKVSRSPAIAFVSGANA